MWAAQYGKADIIKLLLKAGASVEAKNNVSKRVFIFTYVCVCVCVCEGGRGILPSYSMISVKYHIILLLYFITMCRI